MGVTAQVLILTADQEQRLLSLRRQRVWARLLRAIIPSVVPHELPKLYNEILRDAVFERGNPEASTIADLDRAWEAIEKTLARLAEKKRADPVATNFLQGGQDLSVPELIIFFKERSLVRQIAKATVSVTADDFRTEYHAWKDAYAMDAEDEDGALEYVYGAFQGANAIYQKAAKEFKTVLAVFTS